MSYNFKDYCIFIWSKFSGRIIGVFLGLVLGIIYLIVGFFKMVFFSFFIFLGYYFGQKLDNKGNVDNSFSKFLDKLFLDKMMYK